MKARKLLDPSKCRHRDSHGCVKWSVASGIDDFCLCIYNTWSHLNLSHLLPLFTNFPPSLERQIHLWAMCRHRHEYLGILDWRWSASLRQISRFRPTNLIVPKPATLASPATTDFLAIPTPISLGKVHACNLSTLALLTRVQLEERIVERQWNPRRRSGRGSKV